MGKDESLFRPITLFFTGINVGSAKHYSNPLLGQSPGAFHAQPVGSMEPRRAPACHQQQAAAFSSAASLLVRFAQRV